VFYGTTYGSDPTGAGVVYSVTPSGSEAVVSELGSNPSCPGAAPGNPEAGLIAVGSVLYGTAVTTICVPGYGNVFSVQI
jgi:hypothetical protein